MKWVNVETLFQVKTPYLDPIEFNNIIFNTQKMLGWNLCIW